MKIVDLTVTVFEWNDIPAVRYGIHNPHTRPRGEIALITLVTDTGVEGHSFLGSSFRSAYIDVVSLVRNLKPVVVGRNPLDRERLFHELHTRLRSTTMRAIGAIDVALWDICGKVAGLPVHRLLGTYRDKIAAYASSSTLLDIGAYVEQAAELKRQGYKAYKIHPPTNLAECIKTCYEVRKALGPDITIMIDPAGAFTYPEALRLGRVIEELDFHWYEDPIGEADIYNYTKLRQKIDVPIMATEYAPGGFDAYAPWILAQATDYLRADVAIKGGLTAVMKTAHLAEAFQMNIEVHHGGNSLNNVANLHAIMSIRNTEFFEVLMPHGAQKYGLLQDIEVDSEGYVHAFNEPGLGVRIDFDRIKQATLETMA